VLRRSLEAYRSAGADLPFADPSRAHGTTFEGYYWRMVDVASASVIVVLCGVCQAPEGPWAAVALAGHPGGFTRHALVAPASADSSGFGARAEGVLLGSATGVRVRLGDDAWVDLRFRSALGWPGRVFGALGLGHALPGLAQYWHPVVLTAEAVGEVSIGGTRRSFDGATVYAEKNWGPSFARDWWWGHASTFEDGDASVAFAGGRVHLAGRVVAPTAVVVRLGGEVLRFAPPLTRMRTATADDAWRIRGRSPRHTVEIDADAADSSPHVLPVPDVSARRVEMRSAQYLAGRLWVRVSRGPRTLFEGESSLAGLERGRPSTEI
jgi:tocopherol cyclase